MGRGKAVAIGLVGVGALAAFGMRKAHASEPTAAAPTAKPKAKPTKSKVTRVTLSAKFAKAFGVPTSLVLATTAQASGNKQTAYHANKRGGSWGFGQMTLDTAKEIWPRAKAKIGKNWDGTGQGLLDPTINIGLTAYLLSLWWKRYGRNPRNWMLAGYAYGLGPGRVKSLVPDANNGKLPSPLPADVARLKARYVKTLELAEVKNALALENQKVNVSGVGIDDPLFWTPSAIRGEFDRIRNVLDMVNNEASQAVTDKKISGDEWKQWKAVYNAGMQYINTASTWWGSNVIAARKHEQAAGQWRDLFKSRGAKQLAPASAVRPPDKGLMDGLNNPLGGDKMTLALAVGGVAAVGILVMAIKK